MPKPNWIDEHNGFKKIERFHLRSKKIDEHNGVLAELTPVGQKEVEHIPVWIKQSYKMIVRKLLGEHRT